MHKIITDQNSHWFGQTKRQYIKREVFEELETLLSVEEILVLLGVRRSGKSTLVKCLIERLCESIDPKSILYLNLDDPYFTQISENATYLYKIIEGAEKLTERKFEYLFLDEVQTIFQWEKFVKSVYDNKLYKKIIITGSNSHLLKSDYATLLSGRYIEQEIFPLSFSEICSHEGLCNKLDIAKNKVRVLNLLDDMLQFGGFPRCYSVEDKQIKRKILTNYYETILLKDCIAANDIRDSTKLSQLAYYLLTNIAARYSYNKLAEFLGGSEHTVKSYIEALKNGLLIEELLSFSYSVKQQAKSNRKPFSIDNGFITAVAYEYVMKEGKLLENLVYNELRKKGVKTIHLFFDTKECDFIIKYKNEVIAIQVCYALSPESQPREISSLNYAMEKTRADRGVIISYNDELEINDKVTVVPFWQLFSMKKLEI